MIPSARSFSRAWARLYRTCCCWCPDSPDADAEEKEEEEEEEEVGCRS
jgi:hypothetical protein